MDLLHKLQAIADSTGVDFLGVANLAPAHDAILAQGGEAVASFPRAVSIGLALPNAIVDQLPRRAERAVAQSYRHHAYDVINQRLDLLASQVASALQRAGHRVLPVPASQIVDDVTLAGAFSHKLAAHLAGLGWIGRSCLLVTPTAGPRVRWSTVLTDAPLATGTPLDVRCGSCRQCVENGRTGYLIPLGDAAALTERLTKLLEAPDLRHQMGAAARQKAQAEFDERVVFEKVAATYRRLLERIKLD